MARMSFGGSQDNSQIFASFYDQYQSRLEQQAQQTKQLADTAQTAADNNAIDKWQQGELTDAEFLAYAAQRVSATADDPTKNAYWLKVQRDTQKSIQNAQITTTAQDLVDQVKAGTKTWNDVLAFYQQSQSSLKPSDPLYKDLATQIEQVKGTIRDNQVAGAFEKLQYDFESGKITGKAAGAQLRSMAEMYRVNDPAQYYKILEQALGLEKYGGLYSSGTSGGSGGGSGRGSSAKPLNNIIDSLQGMADRINSLSEQYNAGVQVGSITVPNADGSLSNQEILLQNPDGTPSSSMQALDQQMLDTLNQLEQAHLEKGDQSAAGADANRRMDYITKQIQPRNTVAPQQQAASILSTGLSLVEQAANSDDPTLAWAQVQSWAGRVGDWEARLNKTVSQAPSGHTFTADQLRANPELKATQLTTSIVGNPLQGQTTGDFVKQAAGLREFAYALANGDSAAATAALQGLAPNQTGVGDTAKRISTAIDLVTGIPLGKYIRAYVPGEGLVYAPVAPTYTTEIGPDGQPQTVLRNVPVLPSGKPLADTSKGEELVDVMVQIGGRAQMVKGVAQPSFFVDGKAVSESDYQKASKANQSLGSGQTAAVLNQYSSLLIPGENGSQPENWIFDSARGLWFKNRVTKYGGVPLAFVGKNPRLAQQVANQLGIDPKGTSYFDAKAEAARQAAQGHMAVASDQQGEWFAKAQARALQDQQTQDRAVEANAFRTAHDQMFHPGGGPPVISQALKDFGAQLGIRSFDSPQQGLAQLDAGRYAGKTVPLTDTAAVPSAISPAKITLPSLPSVVTQPKLNMLPLLDAPGYTPPAVSAPAKKAVPLPTPPPVKIQSGKYAGKTVPL